MGEAGATTRPLPVVVIHGALRNSRVMRPSIAALRVRGFDPRPFTYRWRRGTLVDHADALAQWLDAQFDRPQPMLGFFTHSMGGLVARAYLQHHAERHAREHRVVMLSPPNRGSQLARRHRYNPLFWLLYGDAGRQLQPELVQRMPAPPAQARVLVLAGGRGDPRGYNRRIAGDNDGVIGLAEMSLPGVEPLLVGGSHRTVRRQPEVIERAAAFFGEPFVPRPESEA